MLNDIFHGNRINWTKTAWAAGIGGVSAGVVSVIASIGMKNDLISAACKDDMDDFIDALAILCGSIGDSAVGSL